MTEFGTRLKAMRVERGLRRSELARLSGVSPSSVSLLEQGERTGQVATVLKLAKGLGVSVGVLMTEDEGDRQELAYYAVADLARTEGMTPRDLAMCVRWYLEMRETLTRKGEPEWAWG